MVDPPRKLLKSPMPGRDGVFNLTVEHQANEGAQKVTNLQSIIVITDARKKHCWMVKPVVRV